MGHGNCISWTLVVAPVWCFSGTVLKQNLKPVKFADTLC